MKLSQPTPTFILGIGAQKTGTTWLDAQLRQLPFCDMGFTKEYHVWDVRFSEICQEFRRRGCKGESTAHSLIRLMQSVDGVYEQYFRQLINEQVRVVGDITPSYSCLDAHAYAHIKNNLEAVGFKIKVIFLMRDPVARNWSSLRMYQREMKKRNRVIADANLIGAFQSFYQGRRQYFRTDYPRTLDQLLQVFEPSSVFIGFYESLFDSQTLIRLSEFLGFDVEVFNTQKRFNDSPSLKLPYSEFKLCHSYYQEVYDYCYKNYPESLTLWPSSATQLC